MGAGSIRAKMLRAVDVQLVLVLLAICAMSMIVLYSAGYNPTTGDSVPMRRQLMFLGAGWGMFCIALSCSLPTFRSGAIPIYFFTLGLLLYVRFAGVVASGARRWINLGNFSAQPSEFAKLAVILLLARLLSMDNRAKEPMGLKELWLPILVMVVPASLILKQPDLGTALIVLLTGGSMLLFAGIRGKLILATAFGALVAVVPIWNMLHDYQRNRVLTLFDRTNDPLGAGYHSLQSEIAVGSGGLLGKGLLQGTQSQLRFLPEQHTDFIFSVLAEEWGFIGACGVLALYGILMARLLLAVRRSEHLFATYVCFGVFAMIYWQTAFNIGMVIRMLPVVGITLPLFSHGGSSVITILTALGVVASVSAYRTVRY